MNIRTFIPLNLRSVPDLIRGVGNARSSPAPVVVNYAIQTLLVIALGVPMLIWPRSVSAGITPAYFTCSGYEIVLKGVHTGNCSSNWLITYAPAPPATLPDRGPTMSQLIGYVNTTQVPGTVPEYFMCEVVYPTTGPKGAPPAPPYCDDVYSITSTPDPKNWSWLIGYVNTNQVAGTAPSYFTCFGVPPIPGKGGPRPPTCLGDASYQDGTVPYSFANAPATPPSLSWFVGYVYTTPPVTNYVLSPRYFIGSVIYMPPGQGPSTVTYGQGTVIGTTVSTTDSWSNTASVSIDPAKAVGIGGITFGESWTAGGSTNNSFDMMNTVTSTTTYKGAGSNSINHDYDQIVIYLGVKINATLDYLGNIVWSVDFSQLPGEGYAETGYPIAVGCLRPGSTIPTGLCTDTLNFLSFVGITAADYPNILGADPFANPAAPLNPDPLRFVLIDSVNFLPDPTTSTTTYSEMNSSTTTNASTTSFSYSVNVGGGISILKISDQLTISNSSSLSNKTGSNASSSFTLSLPSAPYPGPSTLFVYMDTIYKTFMFSFVQ